MMDKNKYIPPTIEVRILESENMIALSVYRTPAKEEYEVLTNKRDEIFTDIWD